MKYLLISILIATSTFVAAQDSSKGYVLAPGQGELIGENRIIKASPASGTNAAVMVLDKLPAGFETTFHIHTNADEFFYVISGTGFAEFNGQRIAIGPGYVIFVPANSEHNMSVSDDGPMELLFFFDQPGADDWFREAHETYFSKSLPMSVEQCNEIGKKYNYFCVDR